MNKFLLQMEGLAVLILSVYFYFHLEFSWVMFFILLFVPDLSALGYLKNVKFGATVYNVFHTFTLPAAILIYSLLIADRFALMIGLIWIAHIGMDRLFGYGLKYPTTFQDTHLNRV